MDPRVEMRLARLRHLRNALASEISMSSERGELMSPSSQAVMMARDALNDALAAAGDPDAADPVAGLNSEHWEAVREAWRRFSGKPS